MSDTFKAILLTREGTEKDSPQKSEITSLNVDDLMPGDVVVDVEYSTLNYKDGLAVVGNPPFIARSWPMIPGIDFAGCVSVSDHGEFGVGDRVLLNGFGVGEAHFGGFAKKARVKGEWLVSIPEGITSKHAMGIGTAGYTAMLCVLELERLGLGPDRGPVLVTGAAGGVGSVAIALLGKLGYHVIASTGRPSEEAYLKDLGASEIVDRAQLSEKGRPLGKQLWAGAIDTVGGVTLANVLAATQYDGVVTACGLAGGASLPTTVMPFIIRDVTLSGIDSVMAPRDKRLAAWNRLAADLDLAKLNSMIRTISLEEVFDAAQSILAGKVRGRTVIDLGA